MIELFSNLISWVIDFFGQFIDLIWELLVYLFSAQL